MMSHKTEITTSPPELVWVESVICGACGHRLDVAEFTGEAQMCFPVVATMELVHNACWHAPAIGGCGGRLQFELGPFASWEDVYAWRDAGSRKSCAAPSPSCSSPPPGASATG